MKNAVKILREALQSEFPEAHVATTTPDAITGPVIRIRRTGGGSSRRIDRPLFDVDCLHPDEDAALTLAEQVRDWFGSIAYSIVNGLAITEVGVELAPQPMPWGNAGVQRFGASYQLHCT
jgi:hypothetical protein